MRGLAISALLLLGSATAMSAHPAAAIVRDRAGNVYYSDLEQIWRIAPNGRKSVVVPDVHSHELALDSAGNLYGEDSEYLGGDNYRHRLWKRAPNGRITDVVPWTNGLHRTFGVVRDGRGYSYYSACYERECIIRRRSPTGAAEVLTTQRFVGPRSYRTNINWLAVGNDGSLYFIQGRDLRAVDPRGHVRTVRANVGDMPFGMWVDGSNNVYVAVNGSRSIVRVARDGSARVVATTPKGWGPTGVTVAPDGSLWILEYSTDNRVRVRRVLPGGRTVVF